MWTADSATLCPEQGAASLLPLCRIGNLFPFPPLELQVAGILSFFLPVSFIRIKWHSAGVVCLLAIFHKSENQKSHLCVRFISTVLFPKRTFVFRVCISLLPLSLQFPSNCLRSGSRLLSGLKYMFLSFTSRDVMVWKQRGPLLAQWRGWLLTVLGVVALLF